MENLQQQLDSFQSKLVLLTEDRRKTKEELRRLQQSLEVNRAKQQDFVEEIQLLKEENKKLKVVSAISGNEEYKRLMKLQLNKLIKEIDLCILELKTSG